MTYPVTLAYRLATLLGDDGENPRTTRDDPNVKSGSSLKTAAAALGGRVVKKSGFSEHMDLWVFRDGSHMLYGGGSKLLMYICAVDGAWELAPPSSPERMTP